MIFPSFLPLLYFLDQTLMLFRCFVVIDTDQQQIAGIVLERTAVPLFLYLRQRTGCTLVPLEFDHDRRFVQVQLAWDKANISKAFSGRQFSHNRVILARIVKGQIDRTAERIFSSEISSCA